MKFNEKFAVTLSYWLSTMAMFYGVCFLAMFPLIFQRPIGLVGWMQYILSVFFQGVALPVLGYTSRKAGDESMKLLKETHDTVMKEMAEIKSLVKTVKHIEKENDEIREELNHE